MTLQPEHHFYKFAPSHQLYCAPFDTAFMLRISKPYTDLITGEKEGRGVVVFKKYVLRSLNCVGAHVPYVISEELKLV